MRSPLARLVALGAFAVSIAACSNGNGSTLPFAGPPNNAGGNNGSFQSNGSGTALLRFVQGAPDIGGVDVCIDQSPNTALSNLKYKAVSAAPLSVTSGFAHTIAVYAVPAAGSGTECATAPGSFSNAGVATAPIATTTWNPAANARGYFVLGGRAGLNLGLYFSTFSAPFLIAPTSPQAIAINGSPAFGNAGLGYALTTGGPVANIPGAGNLAFPAPSTPTTTVTKAGTSVLAALPAQPAQFAVGKGVTTGTIVPLATQPAASGPAGSTYVALVVSVDSATAAGVDVVSAFEPTAGIGF
jgi:hypothetical protein